MKERAPQKDSQGTWLDFNHVIESERKLSKSWRQEGGDKPECRLHWLEQWGSWDPSQPAWCGLPDISGHMRAAFEASFLKGQLCWYGSPPIAACSFAAKTETVIFSKLPSMPLWYSMLSLRPAPQSPCSEVYPLVLTPRPHASYFPPCLAFPQPRSLLWATESPYGHRSYYQRCIRNTELL